MAQGDGGPAAERADASLERRLWLDGAAVIAGLDEVGRGAWAGPLVVGAVALDASCADALPHGVADSKQLSPSERERLYPLIASGCLAWAVGVAGHSECDRLGMTEAQRLAAARALEDLGVSCDHLILDGRRDFVGNGLRVTTVVRGDAKCVSVAAASVLAKVWRDRLMIGLSRHYPQFDFHLNKGYPCPRHRAALAAWGPTAIHRRTWAFMDYLPEGLATGCSPQS